LLVWPRAIRAPRARSTSLRARFHRYPSTGKPPGLVARRYASIPFSRRPPKTDHRIPSRSPEGLDRSVAGPPEFGHNTTLGARRITQLLLFPVQHRGLSSGLKAGAAGPPANLQLGTSASVRHSLGQKGKQMAKSVRFWPRDCEPLFAAPLVADAQVEAIPYSEDGRGETADAGFGVLSSWSPAHGKRPATGLRFPPLANQAGPVPHNHSATRLGPSSYFRGRGS